MDREQKETNSLHKSVEQFVLRRRRALLVCFAGVLAAAVAVCIAAGISDAGKEKGLAAIDSAEYALTAHSEGISAEDEAVRLSKAEEAVAPYLLKKGIVGIRANMLAADIAVRKNDFSKALECYARAAGISRASYTYALCMYNAGVCCEELGRSSDAVTYYDAASSAKDFYLAARAVFSSGRVSESAGDYKKASEYYQKAVDLYADDEWADVSRSRLISLKASGKID
ncbi:MAG: tetratricopeptide repeat protein [Treponema sp.]|nr:tetratricopeptide repeat protein [Treponema sp.]